MDVSFYLGMMWVFVVVSCLVDCFYLFVDCELVALLEDDTGMELLVCNKIISLDLAVKDVHRKIWLPEHSEVRLHIGLLTLTCDPGCILVFGKKGVEC